MMIHSDWSLLYLSVSFLHNEEIWCSFPKVSVWVFHNKERGKHTWNPSGGDPACLPIPASVKNGWEMPLCLCEIQPA